MRLRSEYAIRLGSPDSPIEVVVANLDDAKNEARLLGELRETDAHVFRTADGRRVWSWRLEQADRNRILARNRSVRALPRNPKRSFRRDRTFQPRPKLDRWLES